MMTNPDFIFFFEKLLQAPLDGYAIWVEGRLVTLFSAPGYKGKLSRTINMGATLEIANNGDIIVYQAGVLKFSFRKMKILWKNRASTNFL